MKILGNRVHIEPLTKKTVSAGGIHLPMQYQDDEKQWRVIGVGEGRMVRKKGRVPYLMAPEVKVGDRVLVDVAAGSVALEDGTMIVNAWQIELKW